MSHPDFAVLTVSWELALRADGYANGTVKAYQNAVRSLAGWLAEDHPDIGPVERPMPTAAYPSVIASSRALRQVVADYKRLSAVQGAGRAGDGRASRPQYPGLTGIARTRNRWPGWAFGPGSCEDTAVI